ncbi:L-histidine N(alpha)-methyltransferase, partial [Klebsiella oxytoca]|uniref:L-histidine N(alpha)-methyltransferase n=1 Tax=Klebsiella oxytoca TaxID=571 RepID=UPI001C12B6EC
AVLRIAPGQGPHMSTVHDALQALTDLTPSRQQILADALAGLSCASRQLPSKYFYDARGSRLFEQITQTREYYPTRTELALLARVLP